MCCENSATVANFIKASILAIVELFLSVRCTQRWTSERAAVASFSGDGALTSKWKPTKSLMAQFKGQRVTAGLHGQYLVVSLSDVKWLALFHSSRHRSLVRREERKLGHSDLIVSLTYYSLQIIMPRHAGSVVNCLNVTIFYTTACTRKLMHDCTDVWRVILRQQLVQNVTMVCEIDMSVAMPIIIINNSLSVQASIAAEANGVAGESQSRYNESPRFSGTDVCS